MLLYTLPQFIKLSAWKQVNSIVGILYLNKAEKIPYAKKKAFKQ